MRVSVTFDNINPEEGMLKEQTCLFLDNIQLDSELSTHALAVKSKLGDMLEPKPITYRYDEGD